jgi:hypothetical protein
MASITRKGDTITVGNLRLRVLPTPAPSASEQAKIRASGWVPQTVSFSGEQVAAGLEKEMRNWAVMGWTLNLRQKDGSLLKIDLNNPPTASYIIKRDGLEIQ